MSNLIDYVGRVIGDNRQEDEQKPQEHRAPIVPALYFVICFNRY